MDKESLPEDKQPTLQIMPSDDVTEEKKWSLKKIPAFGIICGLLNGVFFAIGSLFTKLITDMDVVEVLALRSIFMLAVYAVSIAVRKDPIFGIAEERVFLVARSIIGSVGFITIFMAIRLIPISDVATLRLSAPVFVCVIAYFTLKEKYDLIHFLCLSGTIVGVVVIAKPTFIFGSDRTTDGYSRDQLVGVILCVIAACLLAIVMVILRKMRKTPSPVTIAWYAVTQLITCVVFVSIFSQWNYPTSWTSAVYLVGVGISGVMAQLMNTLAYKYEEAGPVSLTIASDIVASYLFEITIFTTEIRWTSIVGTVVICTCSMVILLRKWKKTRPESFENCWKCFHVKGYSIADRNQTSSP